MQQLCSIGGDGTQFAWVDPAVIFSFSFCLTTLPSRSLSMPSKKRASSPSRSNDAESKKASTVESKARSNQAANLHDSDDDQGWPLCAVSDFKAIS